MAQAEDRLLATARELATTLAGGKLTPGVAKLYSQHTRLRANQPGLARWGPADITDRLHDALRLVQSSLIRKNAHDRGWQDDMRRAAEILEWMSHPQMAPGGLPVRLVAAAAYQLAGYPARAAAHLTDSTPEGESPIIRAFLQGRFRDVLRFAVAFWGTSNHPLGPATWALDWDRATATSSNLPVQIALEIVSCLGVLTAFLRWGDDDRLKTALKKLNALSKLMLHGSDPFSWLLTKLCAQVARKYARDSLRAQVEKLADVMDGPGRVAVERYLRLAFNQNRSLAWPSQRKGISRLGTGSSFVLCTPTGSGKTSVAELAILQSLFQKRNDGGLDLLMAPIAMYLVPSKALAQEVEVKLRKVLSAVSRDPVVVTGLYGGTDWGPTDAWLTTSEKTVLICTYEKAEALVRFLGPLFLNRLVLVVLDEAHSVQFLGDTTSLQTAENRALRLESLMARLLTHLPPERGRFIALSAVAAGLEAALARWVTSDTLARPTTSGYRSTRQLVGRLIVKSNRNYEIIYDLLDGNTLRFQDGGAADRPFIEKPFAGHPPASGWEGEGPNKQIRPAVLWAALNLAAASTASESQAVLISITEHIDWYTADFLKLLESTWKDLPKPNYFQPPTDAARRRKWDDCLAVCADYFGTRSREYRLLSQGIVVHHGRMPGIMGRLLVEVVQEGIVNIVIATSTLSEGVNLPFATILVPDLQRFDRDQNQKVDLSPQEFRNLVGRAGRPGFGTEGRTLVVFHETTHGRRRDAPPAYGNLITLLQSGTDNQPTAYSLPRSALLELLILLESQWNDVSGVKSHAQFLKWLEAAVPTEDEKDLLAEPMQTLDSLDLVLLSAIVELEELADARLTKTGLETALRGIWSRCFASFASRTSQVFGDVFVTRGVALPTRVYRDQRDRRRLYSTGLPPREGRAVESLMPKVKEHLERGRAYALWSAKERLSFITELVSILQGHPRFALWQVRKKDVWPERLCWWLSPMQCKKPPSEAGISEWFKYVSQGFIYRTNWAIGCLTSVIRDEARGSDRLEPATLEGWENSGLPWIAFWLKELLTWGTLEPVAAFLLAKGVAVTRRQAENLARRYYKDGGELLEPDEVLDPRRIGPWVESVRTKALEGGGDLEGPSIPVRLLRRFEGVEQRYWRVLPAARNGHLDWLDVAGFPLARCPLPSGWEDRYDIHTMDFLLDSIQGEVTSSAYL